MWGGFCQVMAGRVLNEKRLFAISSKDKYRSTTLAADSQMFLALRHIMH